MTYPNFPDKQALPSLLQARSMLAARGMLASLDKQPAPETVIFCMHAAVMKKFMSGRPARRVKGFLGDLQVLGKPAGRVALASNFGIGAPVLVVLAEELIAWGCRRFVIVGSAGGLQPDSRAGELVVCDRAIRDEGVSHHYLPTEKYVHASPGLVSELTQRLRRAGARPAVGAVWTTDAPYRETLEELHQYRNEGVLAVDMESAALFALGHVYPVETASVLVVGDHLNPEGWSLASDMRVVHEQLTKLIEIVAWPEPG